MIGHPIWVRVGGHLPGVGQGLWYTHEKTCLSPGKGEGGGDQTESM